jgi:hypothetical protein
MINRMPAVTFALFLLPRPRVAEVITARRAFPELPMEESQP